MKNINKQYTLAIDLHGTLLDEQWRVAPAIEIELLGIIAKVAEIANIFVCTGNEYAFVLNHVPPEIMTHISGCIIETGCFVQHTSLLEYLVDDTSIDRAIHLKKDLQRKNYPFVKYFGDRMATVSLFTSDESGGEAPHKYLDILKNDLKKHKYGEYFYATYSSVAIDIIPKSNSKWDAVQHIAQSSHTVAFIDSFNDKEIALHSDITFLPKNTSSTLIDCLTKNHKKVVSAKDFAFAKGVACLLDESYTAGVVQGLRLFYRYVTGKEESDTINGDYTTVIRPEWVPENGGEAFTTQMLPANINSNKQKKQIAHKIKELKLSEYKDGILSGNKTILARAITLIESNAPKHFEAAQELITAILPYTGKSIRIAITGMPGAGKSTFIETFGLFLIDQKKKPAILAIDPSSTITKGSILGDKTRMELLSKTDKAFIRPSPSTGTLGGVARKTKETILLCEAAGYDIILIETVGVGQSEVTVRSMVDFFLLILIAGAGDELQGIKKGVIELADAILINKADGDNIIGAQTAAAQYNNALHYLANATSGWKTHAYTCSAVEKTGIDSIWKVICDFVAYTQQVGIFEERRVEQTSAWFDSLLTEEILATFYSDEKVLAHIKSIKTAILKNEITPIVGVKKVLDLRFKV